MLWNFKSKIIYLLIRLIGNTIICILLMIKVDREKRIFWFIIKL